MVKHAITGHAFELKAISKSNHPSNLELFKNELCALQKLSADKRVVAIKDYWEDDEGIYMVMPYSKRDSLLEVLQATIVEKG